MYRVLERRELAPGFHLATFEAPAVAAKLRPGNFVIIRPDDRGERLPLTAADWDAATGSVSVVFEVVGAGTARLARLSAGETVPTLVGPLGKETALERYGTVAVVGGCYGLGAAFPVARAMRAAGNEVLAVLEARSSFLLFWLDRYAAAGAAVLPATSDGTLGRKGHGWDVVADLLAAGRRIDRVHAIGCTFMMHRVAEATRAAAIPTRVSLNPIMLDGTGMCGVCRCLIEGKVKFACVDGPEFDGHAVDWKNLAMRRRGLVGAETGALRTLESGGYAAARPTRLRPRPEA